MLSSLCLKSPLPTAESSSSSRLGTHSPNNTSGNNNNKSGNHNHSVVDNSVAPQDNHSNSTSDVYCMPVHGAPDILSAIATTCSSSNSSDSSSRTSHAPLMASSLPAMSCHTTCSTISAAGESSHSFSSASAVNRCARVRSPSQSDSGAPSASSTDTQPKSPIAASLPTPAGASIPLATDIIPAIHTAVGDNTTPSSSLPASPVSPASWRTRTTPRPRLLRMLTEPSQYQQHPVQQHHQQHQHDRNGNSRLSEDQLCLTFVSQTIASGSTASGSSSPTANNSGGNHNTSLRHHHLHDSPPQPRRVRARAPSVGSMPGAGWTVAIHTYADERRRLSNTSESSSSGHASNTTSPLASPSSRTSFHPHTRRRSSSIMQTGLRLAVGLSSPPHHLHHSHHFEQNNGASSHASVTEERISSGSIFRKSLVTLPADSERRRDGGGGGGGDLFMVKAAPVTGLTTEDVVEQMRICGSTAAAAVAAASSSAEQHRDGQEMTLVMAVSVDTTLREPNASSAAKRSIDSESCLSNIPSVPSATPTEAEVPIYETGGGNGEGSGDAGNAVTLSDQWQLPSPVWKRARMREDDDRLGDPTRDQSLHEAAVPTIAQPSPIDEAAHQPTPLEPSVSTLALITAPVNGAQTEDRMAEPASPDEATTPINTHPPLPLPSPTSDMHGRSGTFSPPTLLEAFTSSEPVLSPIQSYFGSDPYSPSNFSFPRHDHYLGSILTDDRSTQSGDSRLPIDDYHGFATHPWSEQSTPSHVLSHRWTRRVASSDGVPVLNSSVNHQGLLHHHTSRYERATTRRSRNFAPAVVDRPWHELRSALPFASLSTATVTTRTAASMAGDDGASGSDSDDLYEVDRDLMMAQEHLGSRGIDEADEGQTEDRLDDDRVDEDNNSLDEVLRAMDRDSSTLREVRRLQLRLRERAMMGQDEEEEEEADVLGGRDELVGLEEDDDGLDTESYDGYGEYEMAYSNSFDHNHNLRYSDEDLEDDEEFGYEYQLSEYNHSSTSIHRTPDQRLSSNSFSLPFWSQNDRPSPSSNSHASLSSSVQSRQRGRYIFHDLEGLHPGLELHDLEDDIDHMEGSEDHEIEVDDDIESLRPLDEDEEDELALMLDYESRHQNRRQMPTLSEWRSSTWRMPRIGTAHHPGQSTTALSSDQYDGSDGAQPSEESDEAIAAEYVNFLRRGDAWMNSGSLPSHSLLPMSTFHRLTRSHRRATTSLQTSPGQSSIQPDDSNASSPRRSLFSFSPRSAAATVATATTPDHHHGQSSSLGSPSSSEPTVSALRRNQPTTTTSTATTSTPRLHSSQSRWHTSSTRSRLLVRMLEDRPRLMARRRRYRAGEDSALTLSSPWMEQIWGNPADYLDDDQVDDSYEGLLRLSEQIGDAKPRGVPTKVLRMLDRYLFSWHSLQDGQDHPSMMAQRGGKAEHHHLGTLAAAAGGSMGMKLFCGPSQLQQFHNSGAVGSSSFSSSSVPPHPLVVRKVRSVSQLKSSAGTGNTPLSATASTSGSLGAANTTGSAALGTSLSGGDVGSSNGNNAGDSHARQLRRVTRRISQDCLRDRRRYHHYQSSMDAKRGKPSLELPGLADTCTICLQTYEAKDWLRPLPCRHAFHMGCIDTWLSNNCQCPICRQEVNQGRIESMLRASGAT